MGTACSGGGVSQDCKSCAQNRETLSGPQTEFTAPDQGSSRFASLTASLPDKPRSFKQLSAAPLDAERGCCY